MIEVEPRTLHPPELRAGGGLGLLVLDGLLERDAVLAGVGCAELVGPGDLIRPWEEDEGAASLPFDVSAT